ncbi:hypothetical protein GGG16DRAFT_127263 [Schizophyllum commune]
MGKENLECDRNRLLASARDSDKVRTCSVDLFWRTYAKSWRPLTSNQMNALTAALDEENVYRNKRWVALPDAKKGVAEDVHFKRLEKIFYKVTALAEKTLSGRFEPARRTTKFRCRPRQTTGSEVMGASHKVDSVNTRTDSSYPEGSRGLLGSARNAKIKIRRTGEFVFTADALLTGEFKLFDTRADQFDNAKKTFGHAGHAFYNDVGRIVVFAYTIEGAKMRLWCHTRSHTGISEEFDIHTNPSMFIDFILFSTYASLPVLGVDTTVRRAIDSDRNIQYQFDFYDRKTNVRTTYETIRSIDESSAMELYSRSMRVFEVHPVLGDPFAKNRTYGKETFVLRDYYVFSDVKREREIQGGIQHQLELKGVWEQAEPHFMRIREDGAVWIPRSEGTVRQTVPAPHKDSEPYEFINGDNPNDAGPSTETVRTSRSQRAGKSSHACATALTTESRLHEKKHMRTIYEKVCIDLYKVNDPKLFFHAMRQVSEILRYLKLAGYVHRDVSPGNFLLHYIKKNSACPDLASISQTLRDDWITIISDLEYARPFLHGSGHDAITGTSYYVAVEVQHQSYEFGPQQTYKPNLLGGPNERQKTVSANPHHFSFNFFHDAESALWMALDFVCRKIPSKRRDLVTPSGRAALDVLKEYSALMFVPQIEGSTERLKFIEDAVHAKALEEALTEVYGDDCPVWKVAGLIGHLAEAYRTIEKAPFNPDMLLKNGRKAYDPSLFADEIYDIMEVVFSGISDYYADPANADVFVSIYGPPASDPQPAAAEAEAVAPPQDCIHDDDNHGDGYHTDEAGAGNYSDDDDEDEEEDRATGSDRDAPAVSESSSDDSDATTDAPVTGGDATANVAPTTGGEAQGTATVPASDRVLRSKRKRDDDPSPGPPAPVRTVRRSRTKGAEPSRRSRRLAERQSSQEEVAQPQPAATGGPARRPRTTHPPPPPKKQRRIRSR